MSRYTVLLLSDPNPDMGALARRLDGILGTRFVRADDAVGGDCYEDERHETVGIVMYRTHEDDEDDPEGNLYYTRYSYEIVIRDRTAVEDQDRVGRQFFDALREHGIYCLLVDDYQVNLAEFHPDARVEPSRD